ncbi:MAG: hypothetical protein Tsb0014_03630 [Pleurocapsa sp.]
MKKLTSLFINSIFAWGLISTPGFSQEKLEKIAGTKISIIPPVGFVAATRFSGYQQEENNSSIVVTEIPASIEELQPGLTDGETLAQRGMVLLEQQPVKVNNLDATMLKVSQKAYETEFTKWILLLGNETESVLVTASIPQELEAEYAEGLKTSLLSVNWDLQAKASLTEGLDYSIQEESGDLKLAKRFSNSLLYTKNGRFPAESIDDPIFVVAPSVVSQNLNLRTLARDRLLQTDNLTNIELESEGNITIDGLQGYQIIAVGRDVKSETVMTLYQVILVDDRDYYYIMQGQVDRRLEEQYLPMFEELALSFQRN